MRLGRFLVQDEEFVGVGEMVENNESLVEVVEKLKALVVAKWVREERKEADWTVRDRQLAAGLLQLLRQLAEACKGQEEEYTACVNCIQPLIFLCGNLPAESVNDAVTQFTVQEVVGGSGTVTVPVELKVYSDVLVKGGTEMWPLDWIWISHSKQAGISKLITLNSVFVFRSTTDVLDLLRGVVGRYLGEVAAVSVEGKRNIRYVCGDFVYRGEVKGGQMHGQGTLISNSGVVYTGTFREGKREGKGMQVSKVEGGFTYKGSWHNDKYEGRGVLHYSSTYKDAFKFIGHFKNGIKEGMGVLYRHDGSSLRCIWHNDATMAPVTIHFPSQIVYTGGFSAIPVGYGVENSLAGRYYGAWVGGVRSGKGVFYRFDRQRPYIASGLWVNNSLSGKGQIDLLGQCRMTGLLAGDPATQEVTVTAGKMTIGKVRTLLYYYFFLTCFFCTDGREQRV
jgi:hypothetical protein